VITGELGYPTATAHGVRHAALGRLKQKHDERLVAVTPELMMHASVSPWSALSATSRLQGSTRTHAVDACESAMSVAFPDHVDKSAFENLVPSKLYDRLEHVTNTLKPIVADVLRGSVIGPSLADPADAASRAMLSTTKIAGAPAGTWGGRMGSIPDPGFESSDGALLMLLKQGRALFIDRQMLVKNGVNNVCEMPPLFSSITRNAYFLPPHGCSVILPGIIVPPFAGANYDDESLYSRIGYVIAHEIAHVTAAVAWNQAAADVLLSGYSSYHHIEAIADVAALLAVRESEKANTSSLCMSVSQLWCARTLQQGLISLVTNPAHGTHPPANTRGDLACEFLYRHAS
jgi:hypothetical protein